MIDLYTWKTPNGQKIHIMLEECGLPYTVHPVNIGAGEQFAPEFLKMSPNNKIPVIVDQEGLEDGEPITIFESGAILIYLADKVQKFLPKSKAAKFEVLQWLMFQMASVGPMFGQANHFIKYAPEKVPYGIERYTKEVLRLCDVMNKRLMSSAYLGGGQYTVADMAIFPWIHCANGVSMDLQKYPYLMNWFESIQDRPAVVRGMNILS